ncbi:hypothetical protein PC112_g19988 [Phytophthora cactorum]|uniref:Myb-like domain-containing protein n=1 Tax=Phytophthora cactorum TaxID=29920 RepID=A0A8T1AHQ4_9STRA|nr:hypothetical protein PC112_g19988 [Phytophthora cactorum]KAG2882866.1 hypothetical protein PC115_g21822 [Phytophthora cactorum]
MAESRRRNFTDEEDLGLLQALGDRPFLQPRGGTLAKWDTLAATLIADDSFPRDNLSGKTASGRFDKLVKARREHDAEVATLSGVSKQESETAAQRQHSVYGEAEQQLAVYINQRCQNEVKRVPNDAARHRHSFGVRSLSKHHVLALNHQSISTPPTRAVGKGISCEISPLPTQVAHFIMALPALLPYTSNPTKRPTTTNLDTRLLARLLVTTTLDATTPPMMTATLPITMDHHGHDAADYDADHYLL